MMGFVKKLKKRWLARYHHDLFAWHCEKFFPFDRFLLASEHEYLTHCFQLADDYTEVADTGYRHYSYYSYSHRVKNTEVNSSRMAYGSVANPGEAWELVPNVLEARKVELPEGIWHKAPYTFYGLGWDILANHFKVYFRIQDWDKMDRPILRGLFQDANIPCRPEGLVSFTFEDSLLIEEKAYLFPKLQEQAVFPGAGRRVLMLSSERGMIAQYDVSDTQAWLPRLNPQGQRIIEQYKDFDEELDTIAIKNANDFTIYFP